ncbi:transmembrane protein 79-like [Narcine bancroftii]|uniref:transmembrane protein 79-like n=1 Tax=Narcine bancroftii TaxID=1343680 RepID=UPI003831785B
MSAVLPLIHINSQSPPDEDISKDEARDPGGRGRSMPLEEASNPLLHTSDTLEYPEDRLRPSCLEMVALAAEVLPEEEEEEEQPRGTLDREEQPEGSPLLEMQSEAMPPPCNPSVLVQTPPGVVAVDPELTSKAEEVGAAANGGWKWEDGSCPEHPPFLVPHRGSPLQRSPPPDAEWPDEEMGMEESSQCSRPTACCSRSNLKATAALTGALVVYPCFLYGAYVFLPFDVPLMPNLNARIIYTLRCSTFATVPIVMGIIVYGLAKLCSSSVDPFGKRKDEVEVHLRFVTDSIHLFVLFLINLLVLSTYIPHEVLKLLPLLTAFFALARLIYWVTFAISSIFRGFGYGLTFFPILGLLICNLSYMFVLAPDKMFATAVSDSQQKEEDVAPRQRFWG